MLCMLEGLGSSRSCLTVVGQPYYASTQHHHTYICERSSGELLQGATSARIYSTRSTIERLPSIDYQGAFDKASRKALPSRLTE
jgi:hypothetical protein